jgi:phospholipase C
MQPGPVRHVVVLMLENHSFDQMLGAFADAIPNFDGILGTWQSLLSHVRLKDRTRSKGVR